MYSSLVPQSNDSHSFSFNKFSLQRMSRSIKYGFPAKLENDGESQYLVGQIGIICQ